MSLAEEITLLFHMTVKAGREDKFRELATEHVKTTHAEDEGCINFVVLQQRDNPCEFVLYERWRDRAAVEAHIARMQVVYGPPPPGRAGLPARVLDFLEKSHGVRYDVVA